MLIDVTFNIDPLARALAALPAALDCRKAPMRGAMDAASANLMRGQQRRYVSASGGDGLWLPLKPKTKAARLRAQIKLAGATAKVTAALVASAVMPILYVTGTLERGLFERGSTGHFVDFDRDGVREGVQGGTHPNAPMSIGALAIAQHMGVPSKNIPARPVFGAIDGATIEAVGGDLQQGVSAAFIAAVQSVGSFGSVA